MSWTIEEKEFVILNYTTMGATQCAKKLNRVPNTVTCLARRLGIKRIHEHLVHNIDDFLTITRPEIAYFLGFMWADGTSNCNTLSCEFLSTDAIELIPLFQTIADCWITNRKREGRSEQTTVRIVDKRLMGFLKKTDFLQKSGGSPNKLLSTIPVELHPFWFRGLWDGDGNWYHNEKSIIATLAGCYEQNWDFAETLLGKLNVKYQIRRDIRPNGKSSVIRTWGLDGPRKLAEFMYSSLQEIGLSRKKVNAIHIINRKRKPRAVLLERDSLGKFMPRSKVGDV